MILVLDASVSLALLLREPEAAALGVKLETSTDVRAPMIWRIEVASGILQAKRRGRINAQEALDALDEIESSPVRNEPGASARALFALAESHQLSLYDAAYLELALRLDATLATLDRALQRAAEQARVKLLT